MAMHQRTWKMISVPQVEVTLEACVKTSNGNMLRKEACMGNGQIMIGFIG